MFDKIRNFVRGAMQRMFPVSTIQAVIGEKIAISPEMLEAIERWTVMYKGQAPWCVDQIHSLRLEKGITREFANVTVSEMQTKLKNQRLNKIYQLAIQDLNENFQRGLAIGAFIIKPLGPDSIQFVAQDSFIPVEFDSRGRLRKVVFIDRRRLGRDNFYFRFEYHALTKEGLRIQNKAYHSTNASSIGTLVPLSSLDDWADLPENILYLTDKVDFGYYRNPIDNTIDDSSCGVSVFESAEGIIRKADIQFGRIDWEYESGERAIQADYTAIENADKRVNGLAKLNRRLYKGLDVQNLFNDFSPDMRDEAYIRGLEEYKRDIEFNVGLAFGDLSKVADVEKTAEEVRTSKYRKYNTVNEIQKNLKDCLEDLAYAIAFYNGATKTDIGFECEFKDSILTSEETDRQQDRQDLAAGIMRPEEYRAKWYNETIEDALNNLPEQDGGVQD